MSIQTDYSATQSPAVAGLQATMVPATLISRNVEGAPLGFGVAVQQGIRDAGVVAFTGGSFAGITLLDRSAAGEGDTFRVGDTARVMAKGDVWVVASVAVAAGDPVAVTPAGAFTNVETDNTVIPGGRWDTSTTAASQLAVVRLG
jgi:hypothetical protein